MNTGNKKNNDDNLKKMKNYFINNLLIINGKYIIRQRKSNT